MRKLWNLDKLNKWFIALYAFQMLIALFIVCGEVGNWIVEPDKVQLSQLIDVVFMALSIVAIQLLLKVQKIGFYLFVGLEILHIMIFYIFHLMKNIDMYSYLYSQTIMIIGFFKIILLLLLMLLRKDGKNVYHVLWENNGK